MISIRELSMEYGDSILFEEVDFSVGRGERIGLVGRNGSGKSTFFRLLLGRETPLEGKIEVPSGYTIGHLEQHFDYKHETVIDEVCSILPPDREYEGWKGESILFGLGFTYDQIYQNPKNFSGGYQVKINLAKMLLQESDLILLDEPTNYLDIYSIRWLGQFLRKWQGELILITHDRAFMESVITHSAIIYRGKIRKVKGTSAKIKAQIALEEEIYEKDRVKRQEERKKKEEWINRFKGKASLASRAKSAEKMLERQEVKEKLETIKNVDIRFGYQSHGSKYEIASFENVSFGYNDKKLFENLNFTINKNDKICIMGKNGNGKSTLLQIVHGILKSDTAKIEKNDKLIEGYFGQMNVDRLDKNLTIYEELKKEYPHLEENIIRKVCSQMLFTGSTVHKKIQVLSGGEKSRIMLAKIILQNTNLLLLDEPTNHFDIESTDELMDAIKNYEGAVVMVTHNEHFLREIANKLIVFDNGHVFPFEGGYDDFLEKIGWKEE